VLVEGQNDDDSKRYQSGGWEGLDTEKSLFVLASRQKTPVLRTENPAVDTRTICLPPIEFFFNSPCQKSYSRKIPAKNYRYGRKIPAFWSLEGDFLHSHAWKVKAENPTKQLQIPPENPAASNSRNGQKIPAINYRYGRKIPASKTDTAGKSCG
jgi:hypothetical protein